MFNAAHFLFAYTPATSPKNVLVGNSSNMVLHDTSSADKYLQLTYVE